MRKDYLGIRNVKITAVKPDERFLAFKVTQFSPGVEPYYSRLFELKEGSGKVSKRI